jgi:hypothetical protein
VEIKPPLPPLTDRGWHAVDAWQNKPTDEAGQRRISRLIAAALRYVGDIA